MYKLFTQIDRDHDPLIRDHENTLRRTPNLTISFETCPCNSFGWEARGL